MLAVAVELQHHDRGQGHPDDMDDRMHLVLARKHHGGQDDDALRLGEGELFPHGPQRQHGTYAKKGATLSKPVVLKADYKTGEFFIDGVLTERKLALGSAR